MATEGLSRGKNHPPLQPALQSGLFLTRPSLGLPDLPPSLPPSAVRRAARMCGLREVGEDEEWSVYWTDCSVSLERVMDMKRFQVQPPDPRS